MSTGDYHFTAQAVARGVSMVPPQGQVIIIQTSSETRLAGYSSRLLAVTPEMLADGRQNARQMVRLMSAAEQMCTSISSERLGLAFHMENGEACQDALHALTVIAQVSHHSLASLSLPSKTWHLQSATKASVCCQSLDTLGLLSKP